jgi:hypothetical protein
VEETQAAAWTAETFEGLGLTRAMATPCVVGEVAAVVVAVELGW